MADEGQEIRNVNWREVFGFTHIFGSFRLSRHMSKIVIALLAVILTWGLGLVMDLIFTHASDVYADPQGTPQRPSVVTEPDAFWCFSDFGQWREVASKNAEQALASLARAELVGPKADYEKNEDAVKAAREEPGKVLGQLTDAYEKKLDKVLEAAEKTRDEKVKAAEDEKDEQKQKDAIDEAEKGYLTATRGAYADYAKNVQLVKWLKPQGVFATFSDFEGYYFRQGVEAVLHGHVFSGFNQIANQKQMPAGQMPRGGRLTAAQANANQDPLGLLACLSLMAQGVIWMFAAHWIYAVIFTVLFLLIWSVALGGVARAAALQATRDEKAGVGECLRFGLRKWSSFLAAPLVPIVVFLVLAFLVALPVSLPGLIPGFGGIWIGIWFGLVLIVSLALALLLIGLVAGVLLMAPTIAVEGSDLFDACTRSYQFVMSRPWRSALYGLVAAGYGTICYLFVRAVLFATLKVSHFIVGMFDFTSRDTVRAGASKWDLMWPGPTFENFHGGGVAASGLNGADWFGANLVCLWVMLVSAVLVAWVVSYLMSASTYVYLLLRRAEDATELDEVYIEEPMEEMPETEPEGEGEAPAEEPAPTEDSAPAEEPGPTEEPAEGEGDAEGGEEEEKKEE